MRILAAIFIFLALRSAAQNITFEKGYEFNAESGFNSQGSLAVDHHNRILVGFTSVDTQKIAGSATINLNLLKLSGDGSVIFSKRINTPEAQYNGVGIITDSSGYYISGTRSSGTIIKYEPVLIKMDTTGNVTWANRIYQLSATDFGLIDANMISIPERIFLSGDKVSFGFNDDDSTLIMKIDKTSGNILKTVSVKTLYSQSGTVLKYYEGKLYCTYSGYKDTNSCLSVIVLDTNLNLLTAKTFYNFCAGINYDLHKINNSLYLAGKLYCGTFGLEDIYIMKLDTSLNISACKIFGTQYPEEAFKITDQNNELIVLCEPEGFTGKSQASLLYLDTNLIFKKFYMFGSGARGFFPYDFDLSNSRVLINGINGSWYGYDSVKLLSTDPVQLNACEKFSALFGVDDKTFNSFDSCVVTVASVLTFPADSFEDVITNEFDPCKVEEPVTATIPNVFTPNGDGVNDFFSFSVSEIEYEVIIYNRWGMKMFEGNQTEPYWNGKNNNIAVSDGTYFYIIKTSASVYKGYINVQR